MYKYDQVTLPETTVKFTDSLGYLMLKEIYLKGLYPSFIEKMAVLVSKYPQVLTMHDQKFIQGAMQDNSQEELASIKGMLLKMQESQDELMSQVVDYSDSMEIISKELHELRELAKLQQASLTGTLQAISESASSVEILAKLSEKSIVIDEVVKQSETVISKVETNIAQAPVRSAISVDPIKDVSLGTSKSSELEGLDFNMFDDGLSVDELADLAKEFRG